MLVRSIFHFSRSGVYKPNRRRERFSPGVILLSRRETLTISLNGLTLPSVNGSDDRARTSKMVGARINDCCEDRDGRCKN